MFNKQVKCTDCGFLGIISPRDFEKWDEILPRYRSDLWGTYKDIPLSISCLRGQDHLIAGSPPPGKPISSKDILRYSHVSRKCIYYYRYHPGYTPEQHLELLKERTQRRFLIIVTLLSAAVGAGIATIANLVWSLLTK